MSRWFSLHDAMLDDSRVGLLPDKFFRTYISILCAVSKHGPEIISEKGFARYIRVTPRHLQKALAMFADCGLMQGDTFKHFRPAARIFANEWAELRRSVFERDDFTCTYCGERGGRLECDHIVPHSRGGSDNLSNLTTACFACNRSKRDKTLEEWRADGTHPKH